MVGVIESTFEVIPLDHNRFPVHPLAVKVMLSPKQIADLEAKTLGTGGSTLILILSGVPVQLLGN
jgi:hypothetical protein